MCRCRLGGLNAEQRKYAQIVTDFHVQAFCVLRENSMLRACRKTATKCLNSTVAIVCTHNTLLEAHDRQRATEVQAVQEYMTTQSSDLPLELRGLIFENYLQDLLNDQPFTERPLPVMDLLLAHEDQIDKHFDIFSGEATASECQKAAALELKRLFKAIKNDIGSFNELERIANRRLDEVRAAGHKAVFEMRKLCEKYQYVRNQHLWSGLFGKPEDASVARSEAQWGKLCRKVRAFEWQCNVTEQGKRLPVWTKLWKCKSVCVFSQHQGQHQGQQGRPYVGCFQQYAPWESVSRSSLEDR